MAVSIASIKRAEAGKNVLFRTAVNLARFFDVDISLLLIQPTVETNSLSDSHSNVALPHAQKSILLGVSWRDEAIFSTLSEQLSLLECQWLSKLPTTAICLLPNVINAEQVAALCQLLCMFQLQFNNNFRCCVQQQILCDACLSNDYCIDFIKDSLMGIQWGNLSFQVKYCDCDS